MLFLLQQYLLNNGISLLHVSMTVTSINILELMRNKQVAMLSYFISYGSNNYYIYYENNNKRDGNSKKVKHC